MVDYKIANSLAAEALNLWGKGQLEAAADHYARAISLVPAYPDWHGAYAGVLQKMGRHEQATQEFEAALELQLAQADPEATPSVKVARYLLADHLTSQGSAARGLEVLAPAVKAFPNDWLVGTAQALALFAVGRTAEAKSAAEHALLNSGSEPKRVELAERLYEVLAAVDG